MQVKRTAYINTRENAGMRGRNAATALLWRKKTTRDTLGSKRFSGRHGRRETYSGEEVIRLNTEWIDTRWRHTRPRQGISGAGKRRNGNYVGNNQDAKKRCKNLKKKQTNKIMTSRNETHRERICLVCALNQVLLDQFTLRVYTFVHTYIYT